MKVKVKYQPVGYTYKDTIAMAHTMYDSEDRICACCKHKQAAHMSGISTLIYAALIIVHEVVLEKSFFLRNYVVIAFCVVWVIVTVMMFVALTKDAPFLLIPWLVLSILFTPLFVLSIVAGCRVLALCMSVADPSSCVHELHIFGTLDHTAAISKLALMVVMLFSNIISILIVYKNYMLMKDSTGSYMQNKVDVQTDGGRSLFRYHRFSAHDHEDTSPDTVLEELLTEEDHPP